MKIRIDRSKTDRHICIEFFINTVRAIRTAGIRLAVLTHFVIDLISYYSFYRCGSLFKYYRILFNTLIYISNIWRISESQKHVSTSTILEWNSMVECQSALRKGLGLYVYQKMENIGCIWNDKLRNNHLPKALISKEITEHYKIHLHNENNEMIINEETHRLDRFNQKSEFYT